MRLFAFAFLLASGCRESDVHVYRVAKEDPDATVGVSALIAASPAASSETAGLPVTWKTPAGWKSGAPSGMRLASYDFAGADISVVAIPGEAGGELANVNRWRGQLGLPGISQQELAARAARVKSGAGALLVVDFTGKDPQGRIPGKARLLGAILALDDKQWFFKAMGAEAAVAKAKPSFMDFLRSLKRASNS